ncbi:TPA: hypothetical protein ACSTLU_001755 [Serratia fonticola]
MGKINETPRWESDVYQLSRGDKVEGGPNGEANRQAKQLSNRTLYLKNEIEAYSGLIKSGEMPFSSLEDAKKAITDGKIAEGERFSARSDNQGIWVDEYINTNGIPVKTGKSLVSAIYSAPLVKPGEDDEDGTQAGLSVTIPEQFFFVIDQENESVLRLYKNNGDAADLYAEFVEKAELEDVKKKIYASETGGDMIIADPSGWVAARLNNERFMANSFVLNEGLSIYLAEDGEFVIKDAENNELITATDSAVKVSSLSLSNGTNISIGITDNAMIFVDKNGFIGGYVPLVPEGHNGNDSNIVLRNINNLATSASVKGQLGANFQRPVAGINHFITDGQSLAAADEGWPSKTPIAATLDNYMIGKSVRPASIDTHGFTPVGGNAVLQPLQAVVQSFAGGGILTDEQVAALAPSAKNQGESLDIAATNFLRMQYLDHRFMPSDPDRLWVVSNTAATGAIIERLMPGRGVGWTRKTGAITLGKQLADAAGKSYCIPAIRWVQGEFNYNASDPGDGKGPADNTRDGYLAKLKSLYASIQSELCGAIAGQLRPPAFFLAQTGAGYTVDATDLSIGMAHWDFAQQEACAFLVGPYYPYTDKGGHLSNNGYRWLGCQFGKVEHLVLTLGQDWKPLSPRHITHSGKNVLIDFHVPVPPLAWDKPYVALTATDYRAKGFSALDDSGPIMVNMVEIAADTIVRLTLDREPVGKLKIRYADKSNHNGNGCLRDSDPTVAPYNYEYAEGSGDYLASNITALVGKPYPLHNWCIAFSLESTKE